MIAKKKYAVVFTVFMFLTSLAMVSVPVQSQIPVTISVDQSPLGYIEAKPAGTTFWVNFTIDTGDLVYLTPEAIAGWGIYVQVNASVLKPLRVKTAVTGYFLWEFAYWEWLPYPTPYSSVDPATGLVDVSEYISPTPLGGAATDGVLPAPFLLVSIQYESLSLYDSTVIDIVLPEYMDCNGNWVSAVDVDGEYRGFEPIPVGANLVGRKGWAEHNRFTLSKHGDPEVPDSHGTPGIQTLYAKIKNIGDLPLPVRATFRIMKGGIVEPMVVSNVVTIDPGETVIVQGDARTFTADDIGKWTLETKCEYYFAGEWNAGATTKIKTFVVLP